MQGQKIGYIRVGSVEQNTIRQLEGMNLDKIFTDKCSGKDTNRPQLLLMLEFVRQGDTIYVHSMDRLARNLDDLRKLVDKIIKKDITITFVKEGLTFTKDEKNPISKLILSVVGAIAEFERSLIKERQLEGIELAKKLGKYKGRSKSLSTEQINEMHQMVADRYKKVDIAKKFGICRDTLYRYLKNNSTNTKSEACPKK